MLAVVALAEQSLNLERQVKKREQAQAEVERRLQAACSAALSVQHSALAEVEKTRKFREELEDVQEPF